MLEAKVVETIDAAIDKVWPEISNFQSIKPGPGIDAVDYQGEGVGMTRHIKTANGTVVERLESFDSAAHRFSYAIVNDDSPLPFSNYSSVVKLETDGGSATKVTWVGSFDSRGIPDEQAVELACSIYKNLIGQTREAVS